MIRFLSLVLVTLAVAACSETSAPDGVAVEVNISPVVVAAGATLSMDVQVTNTSTRSYVVPGSAGGCIANFQVRDAARRVVPASDPRICDAAAAYHPLPPGGSLNDLLAWQVPLSGLSPGHYSIRARVAVSEQPPLEP